MMKRISEQPALAEVMILGLIVLVNLGITCHGQGQLQFGFYKGKCGKSDVENVVAKVVSDEFAKDPTIVAALLRMHFHDCFVRGCDASILLDGSTSEKTSPPNFSVRGFEVIDAVKAAVEKICPGRVSCADIIAMATRDTVSLAGGGRYNIQTGRRDGLISRAADVNLPGPTITVPQALQLFASRGISTTDAILLLGGHTVGVTHCSFIMDRLYNFRNTGLPDPTMDRSLAFQLRRRCPLNTANDSSVNLDQNSMSSNRVDKSYYREILLRRGVMKIDQELALSQLTRGLVAFLANGFVDFPTRFGQAMVKLGAVQVLTGSRGEIRTKCRATNGNK